MAQNLENCLQTDQKGLFVSLIDQFLELRHQWDYICRLQSINFVSLGKGGSKNVTSHAYIILHIQRVYHRQYLSLVPVVNHYARIIHTIVQYAQHVHIIYLKLIYYVYQMTRVNLLRFTIFTIIGFTGVVLCVLH